MSDLATMEHLTNEQSKTHVSAVSIYGSFPMRSLTIAEAVEFVASRSSEVICILGAMRPGHLGRESLELADLERWVHEDESAAEWDAVTTGERFAAEMGILR
jgi:hypothetical protein